MKNKFIKHERAMDVCFKVLNFDEFSLFLECWNMGQVDSFPIGEYTTIPIPTIYKEGWQYANPEDIFKLRSAVWTKF